MVSDSCWCVGVQLYFISFNQFHEYVLSDHSFTLDNIFKSFHHGHQHRNNTQIIIILNQKSCTTLFVSPSWSCIFATSFPFLRIDNKHFFMSYVQHVTKNRYSPGSGTTNSPDWNFKTRKYIKNWNTQISIFYLWFHEFILIPLDTWHFQYLRCMR